MSIRPQILRAALFALFALFGFVGMAEAQIKSGDDPEASEIWHKVRAGLFADRSIRADAQGVIELQAPARAEDAAVVPIAIMTALAPSSQRFISTIYLVIDNNPSPIAAIFRFTPQSGRADIETRVRIDEYTFVRAIAETNDGQLYMAAKWVKASGGCSAPAAKDIAEALQTLGEMKFRLGGEMAADKPVLAQLMISHPNSSGLAMDQATRHYIPAHFVQKVDVAYRGLPVMSADLDISISENPNLRFYFVPGGDGELKAEVVDSQGLHFRSALKLQVPS